MQDFFNTEAAKLRNMTFVQKVQYIFTYYTFHIVASIAATVTIIAIIYAFAFNTPRKEYLYIAWFGHGVSDEWLDELGQRLSVVKGDGESGPVPVTSYLPDPGDPATIRAFRYRFSIRAMGGLIDMGLASSSQVRRLASEDMLDPVHELLAEVHAQNPVLYSQLAGRLRTITFDVFGETRTDIMAISLAGSPLLTDMQIAAADLYLVVIINSPNSYRVANVLELLLR